MNTVRFIFWRIIRKTGWFACILLVVLCSCNSSKHASKKRRKMAPCDCPKFNYAPQNESEYKTYALTGASLTINH